MVKVGTIVNTHGLKGECKVYPVTDDIKDRFSKGRVLWLEEKERLVVTSCRMHKGMVLVCFEGITSIEQAETMKTGSLYIDTKDLPATEQGVYYYYQLMDCAVYDEKKTYHGKVVDILETGTHIVLRVKSETAQFLIPFVPAFILEVDPEEKTIVFQDMEGLR